LPADVTYGSHSASQGSYNSGSGLWTAGDLGVGATATLTIEASVNSGTAGGPDIVNTASLNDVCQEDTDPSNNSDTASIHVALVDLEVAKTVDEPRPNEGDTITYTITVDNSGPDYASLVDISDLLPSGVTYDSDTTSQGSYDDGTGVWTVGQIDAGNSAILEIEAIVDAGTAGGPDITNAVAVASVNEDETDTADNSDTATIHVPLVDVSIAKSIAVPADSAPNANEGDPVTFTITATNAGPDYASELRIGDVLNGFTMTGNSATLGSYNGATWSIAQLDPGDSATLTIDATVDAGTGGTTLANTAAVASVHEKDADNGNDSDSVDVYIELSDIELSKTGALLECAEQWTVPLSKGNGDGDYRLRIAGDQPIFHIMGYGDIAGAGGASCDYHHVAARFTAATNSWGPHTLELFIDGVKVNTHTSGGTPATHGCKLPTISSTIRTCSYLSAPKRRARCWTTRRRSRSTIARSAAILRTSRCS